MPKRNVTVLTPERYRARARVAKALAHPSRQLILDLLQGREHCVADLTQRVGADQSTVSKHLAILRQVGLVTTRRERATIYYLLTCPCLAGFWQCLDTVLLTDLQRQRAALRGCRAPT